ncbi:hypothetical protein WBG78_23025 [Chryseolinea sp. T2]|uniref:hypothetical protein n=1 Tax=Chryseolinea sp. T2 TaxID=3129255 RepID=UPI003077457C
MMHRQASTSHLKFAAGLLLMLLSCRATQPLESLSPGDNELFCKGTKNLIAYLKQSKEIKNDYKDNLHNKEEVSLKIDSDVFKGPPLHFLNEFGLDSTDTVAMAKVNYQCYNPSDGSPDFEVTFSYYPRRAILSALVMTILIKPG